MQKDGGIYAPKLGYRNYETCIALMCFVAANADHRYNKIIKNAEKYIKATQWTEAENENDTTRKIDKSDPFYGGAGYGKNKRPDLSNTAFMVDALKDAGNGPDDEAMKKALVFVSRCQNLESEYNSTPAAAKNPDGGFYYTPADGGESGAGKLPNGGLRSYASMTYSGLKSMIYCGLKADDPRVKAATKWIKENYDLKTNPGLGEDGLYYYYHVFAKALDAMGVNTLTDSKGVKHDWRKELVDKLAARQQPNGSWTNPKSRWLEGDPNLVTAYVLLAFLLPAEVSGARPVLGTTRLTRSQRRRWCSVAAGTGLNDVQRHSRYSRIPGSVEIGTGYIPSCPLGVQPPPSMW